LRVEPLDFIPTNWTKLWGVDFPHSIGSEGAHPFAAVLAAIDTENDIIYIIQAFRSYGGLPLEHAAAMKRIASNVPVAWPHDGSAQRGGEGETTAQLYKAQGLWMLPNHATFPDGGYSPDAAVTDMRARITTQRFKVVNTLSDWFAEYRSYHYKDGKLVQLNDDLLSATFKILMMKRKAATGGFGPGKKRESGNYAAKGTTLGDTGELPWGWP
jgi:hypothetical protein